MKNKKTIFIDLDGTLMHRDFSISQKNIKLINEAINNSINVCLISGRPYKFVDYLSKKINSKIDAIGFNGAYSKGLIDQPMDKSILMKVVPFIATRSKLLMLKSLDCIFSNTEPSENFIYPINDLDKVNIKKNVNLLNIIKKENIYKLLCVYENENAEKEINDYLSENQIFCSNYPRKGCEIVERNTNQGTAVKKYLSYYGLDVKDTYFIGDDYNDIPMFKLGGYNFVMNNAESECKFYADKICPSIENDGVSFAINIIIEENKK